MAIGTAAFVAVISVFSFGLVIFVTACLELSTPGEHTNGKQEVTEYAVMEARHLQVGKVKSDDGQEEKAEHAKVKKAESDATRPVEDADGESSRPQLKVQTAWTWETFMALGLLLVLQCPCLLVAGSILNALDGLCSNAFQGAKASIRLVCQPAAYKPPSTDSTTWAQIITFRCVLNFILPVVAACLVCLATPQASQSAPSWVLAGSIPVVIFMIGVEVQLIMKFLGGTLRMENEAQPAVDSISEQYDSYGDGCVFGLLLHNDHRVHSKMLQLLTLSKSPFFHDAAPLFNIIHLWGLSLITWITSQLVQVCFAYSYISQMPRDEGEICPITEEEYVDALSKKESGTLYDDDNIHILSRLQFSMEISGMKILGGRVGYLFAKNDQFDPQAAKEKIAICLSSGLMESAVQSTISISYMMMLGVESLLDQPITLCSTLMSLTTLLKKGIISMRLVSYANLSETGMWLGYSSTSALIGIAAWNIARLYFIQTCPHHAWQISSGCVRLFSE